MSTTNQLTSRLGPVITTWLTIPTKYFSQGVENRVPFRYHLTVLRVSERHFRLPAVLQNQRDTPTHLAYEAKNRMHR